MKRKPTLPKYESWPRKRVKVADLYLDPKNIRLVIETKFSQAALINDLFANEKAMQLLESIVSNRFFPDEMPVVVKEGKKYVVIDGNRRVAALKVILRPALYPPKEQAAKQLLKGLRAFPKEIDVVVAPDRESVLHLLASKHTQNMRRPWRPLRQAYFYKAELDRGKTAQDLRNEYPGIDVDRFLRYINVHRIAKAIDYNNEQITKSVHSERSFPVTTLERLYDDEYVRGFLGFDFDKDGDVSIRIAKREFEKGFKKIVQDIVEKVKDSRSLNSEDDRRKYLDSFPESAVPNTSKSGRTLKSRHFKEREKPRERSSTKLVPRDIVFTLQAQGVYRMLLELQNINYQKFPNATYDLLRSFLECALKSYFIQKGVEIFRGKGKQYVTLDDVLQKFRIEMDDTSNRRLSQATQRIISNDKMASYSAQFLNASNHNPDVFAKAQDVKDAWDMMEGIFRHILNPVEKS